jgi:hypothetical protein
MTITSRQLAFETIHYAVEALMFGRMHALEVIREDGNGLSPEQKAAICQKIQALHDRPKTVKDKNRLENRLIGVLQPATLRFLERPDDIAEVFDWLPPSREKPNQIRFFAIQTTIPEIKRALSRHKVRNLDHLFTDVIQNDFIEEIFGHLRPPDKPQMYLRNEPFIYGPDIARQFFLLCPKFHRLILRQYELEDYMKTLGEGLKLCGRTKFDIIEIYEKTEGGAGIVRHFPPFKRLRYSHDLTKEELPVLVGCKHIKHLEITVTPSLLDELACLEQMQLTELKLKINASANFQTLSPFEEKHIAIFTKLPLVSLDLSWSQLSNKILALLPQLTTLRELDLSYAGIGNCNTEVIDQLVEATPSLETITLGVINHQTGWENNLSIESIMRLQNRLPQVNFQDRLGASYRDTYPGGAQ